MRQKRILVTDGTGFIGSYLCEKLLQLGNDVVCMENVYRIERYYSSFNE